MYERPTHGLICLCSACFMLKAIILSNTISRTATRRSSGRVRGLEQEPGQRIGGREQGEWGGRGGRMIRYRKNDMRQSVSFSRISDGGTEHAYPYNGGVVRPTRADCAGAWPHIPDDISCTADSKPTFAWRHFGGSSLIKS